MYLVGCDPEFFLVNKETGNPISAYGLLPGTKANPFRVKRGAIQVDGMAAEINILPTKDSRNFKYNISRVINQLKCMLPEDLDICASSHIYFSDEYMSKQPPEALELGCDPDFNAYDECMNEPPNPHPTLRTAAGHIHIGWRTDGDPYDLDHIMNCVEITKILDARLGLLATVVDNDSVRKEIYGKAGSFRPKSYGVEYRTLSNFWVGNPKLTNRIFNSVLDSMRSFSNGYKIDSSISIKIREAIDNHDVEKASHLAIEIKNEK